MAMRTYTSAQLNPSAFLREFRDLYRIKTGDIPGQVSSTIAYMRQCEQNIAQTTGIALGGIKILIIGPGQTPREMVYLGMKNEVTGIDLDVIPKGWDLGAYLTMLRQNGPMRTVKTVVRKSLGIDRRFENELKRQLGITTLPNTTHLQMDATAMTFPDASFDFVYSFSVFEHLPDPGKVMEEVIRILKPGGGYYISLHQYSSDEGCHDLRLFTKNREGIPYWPHLRPEHEHLVQPNAYMNKLRFDEWLTLFQAKMPGVSFHFDGHDAKYEAELRQELKAIRAKGELADYSDRELLTVNIVGIWRKPELARP